MLVKWPGWGSILGSSSPWGIIYLSSTTILVPLGGGTYLFSVMLEILQEFRQTDMTETQ